MPIFCFVVNKACGQTINLDVLDPSTAHALWVVSINARITSIIDLWVLVNIHFFCGFN